MLPFRAPEIGQPSPAAPAAAANVAWSIPGTCPLTAMCDDLTPSPATNATVAVASSESGGVPASPS